jgi:hypothetical protein
MSRGKDVRTYEGFLDLVLEEIRKLDSGSADLDVARAKHSYFKDALRCADQSLQAARLYKNTSKRGPVPLIWSSDDVTE